MVFKTSLKVLSLIALVSNFAVAGDADFTLTNRTGYDIDSVYVAPSKSKDWGKDHLGKRILSDGKSRLISFDKSGKSCIYDMSIHWVGYSANEDVLWERLNLCDIHKITLRYNSKTNVTSITTD
jgi:hypothetical protein